MPFLLVLIFVFATASTHSEASNSIDVNSKHTNGIQGSLTWYMTEWPPAFILSGPQKGTGWADSIMLIFEREMPQYTHHRVIIPYSRILHLLEKGHEGCYPTNIYGKPYDFGVTSIPHVLAPGHSIFIHKESKNKFPQQPRVSLSKLLNRLDLKLGVRSDLEFGPTLSPILKRHKDQNNVILRSGHDLADGLVGMLHLRRIDYFIEYNFVMKFVTDKIGVPLNDFIEIPMEENEHEYIRGAVECPNTEWGQGIIEQVKIGRASCRERV